MTMFENFPDVMNVMDVAKALRVSRNTAYEYVHSKGFPAINVGKQIRVSKLALIAWIDRQNSERMAS